MCQVQQETEKNTGEQTISRRRTTCATLASGLCFDNHINTLNQYNSLNSHKLMLKTYLLPKIKIPNITPQNEGRKSWICRHSSGETSRTIQMLTLSEL